MSMSYVLIVRMKAQEGNEDRAAPGRASSSNVQARVSNSQPRSRSAPASPSCSPRAVEGALPSRTPACAVVPADDVDRATVVTREPLDAHREQAAAALGISLATLDRHVVPVIATVVTESGRRLIPVAELGALPRRQIGAATSGG
jgi:hypothetical protein